MEAIRRVHRESGGTYGSPRIHQALQALGYRCGEHRVARLMRRFGIRARVVRVYRRAPGVHAFFDSLPNARRKITPMGVNQIWVADVTAPAGGTPPLLPGRRDGPVFAADRRVGAGRAPRRGAHGARGPPRAAPPARAARLDLSHRPRERVRRLSLSPPPRARRRRAEHESAAPQRRQQPHGVVLPHPEGRPRAWPDVPLARPVAEQPQSLHRPLLQSPTASLESRLPLTGTV